MSDYSDETWASLIGKFVAACLLLSALYSLHGVVVRDLWDWFVVPLGAIPLAFGQAVGISILAGLLTSRSRTTKNKYDEDRPPWAFLMEALFGPLFSWFVGWIVHTMS